MYFTVWYFYLSTAKKFLPIRLEKCRSCCTSLVGNDGFVLLDDGYPITIITLEGFYNVYIVVDHKVYIQFFGAPFKEIIKSRWA